MRKPFAVHGTTYSATIEATKKLGAPPLAVRRGACLDVVGVVVAVVGGCGCSHYLGQKPSVATPSGAYPLAVSSFLLVLHPNGRTVDYMDYIGWNDCVESLAHWTSAALATT